MEIKVELRDGYYAAITNPFALTAYGDTEEQAEKRASCAVDLLFDNWVGKRRRQWQSLREQGLLNRNSREV